MKNKLAVFAIIFLVTLNVTGQVSVTELQTPTESDWSAEAHLNTVSNSSGVTFGPTLLYKFSTDHQLGLRMLAPIGSLTNGTTSLFALYRYHFSAKTTRLFGEVTFGQNWYYFEDTNDSILAASVGTNIGVLHHLTKAISFGGLAGFEWTNIRVTRKSSDSTSNAYVPYGRIALFGSLAF